MVSIFIKIFISLTALCSLVQPQTNITTTCEGYYNISSCTTCQKTVFTLGDYSNPNPSLHVLDCDVYAQFKAIVMNDAGNVNGTQIDISNDAFATNEANKF